MTAAPSTRSSTGKPSRPPPIAVTMGDPAGIGPDITLMSWHQRARHGLPAFVVYAEPDLLVRRAQELALDVPLAILGSPSEAAAAFTRALPIVPVEPGRNVA